MKKRRIGKYVIVGTFMILTGVVGVSEGGFIALFKNIYPQTMINGAMLLSRGVNFYLFVIVSGFVVARSFWGRGKK